MKRNEKSVSVVLVCLLVGCAGSSSEETEGTGGSAAGGGTMSSGGSSSAGGGSPGSGGANTGDGDGDGISTGTIVLHATFDEAIVGAYGQDAVEQDFGATPSWNDGLDEGRATIEEEANTKFLRVTYPAGQYGPGLGGVQFTIPLGASYTELFLAYRVRFGSGFEWVKGGKLPGLVGGTAPTGCLAKDDPDSLSGFSARMMWRAGGLPVQYLYFPERISECGDDYDYLVGGISAAFSPGTWHTVQHRIVMNDPGMPNGIMQAWFDGQLAVDEQSFLWRAEGYEYEVDALYFSTFFGGGDDSWAPSTDQTIDYDDFVIATGPISL